MLDNIAVSAGVGIDIFSGVENSPRDAETISVDILPEELQHIVTQSNGEIDVTDVPLRQFSGFQAYNVDQGIIVWKHQRNDEGQLGFSRPTNGNAHNERSQVEDFKLWNIFGEGVHIQYSTQVDLINGLILGDLNNPISHEPGSNGNGRGYGVGSNDASQNLLFQNLHVEGFTYGIRLLREGKGENSLGDIFPVPFVGSKLVDSYLANNTFNLFRHKNGSGEPSFPGLFCH